MHRDSLARPRAAHRVLAAAAIAAAIAAASPAAAQARKEAAAKTAPRATSTSAATAPAAAPAAKPAAVPLPLPPQAAEASPEPRVGTLAVSAGPWAGFDLGQSAALHVDYGFLRTPQTWTRLELEVRLAVMVARPTDDTELTGTIVPPVGPPVQGSTGVEKVSAWVIEAVPTLRLRLPVNPKFAIFADAGLGIAQTIESYERDELYQGHTERTENVTGLVVHLGAGLAFQLSERTRLLFVPLALSLQLGPDFSAYVPTLGLAYRI